MEKLQAQIARAYQEYWGLVKNMEVFNRFNINDLLHPCLENALDNIDRLERQANPGGYPGAGRVYDLFRDETTRKHP